MSSSISIAPRSLRQEWAELIVANRGPELAERLVSALVRTHNSNPERARAFFRYLRNGSLSDPEVQQVAEGAAQALLDGSMKLVKRHQDAAPYFAAVTCEWILDPQRGPWTPRPDILVGLIQARRTLALKEMTENPKVHLARFLGNVLDREDPDLLCDWVDQVCPSSRLGRDIAAFMMMSNIGACRGYLETVASALITSEPLRAARLAGVIEPHIVMGDDDSDKPIRKIHTAIGLAKARAAALHQPLMMAP